MSEAIEKGTGKKYIIVSKDAVLVSDRNKPRKAVIYTQDKVRILIREIEEFNRLFEVK